MIYLVEGYNKDDYITNIIGWELLKIFTNESDALDYVKEMENKNYICKIEQSEVVPYSEKPLENSHWEIFSGI